MRNKLCEYIIHKTRGDSSKKTSLPCDAILIENSMSVTVGGEVTVSVPMFEDVRCLKNTLDSVAA